MLCAAESRFSTFKLMRRSRLQRVKKAKASEVGQLAELNGARSSQSAVFSERARDKKCRRRRCRLKARTTELCASPGTKAHYRHIERRVVVAVIGVCNRVKRLNSQPLLRGSTRQRKRINLVFNRPSRRFQKSRGASDSHENTFSMLLVVGWPRCVRQFQTARVLFYLCRS